MNRVASTLLLLIGLSYPAHAVAAADFAGARYAEPVGRYGHYALGRPHEYAVLEVTNANGEPLTFRLPDDEVFEDLLPRRVRIRPDEPENLLTIVSERATGSRLVLFQIKDGRLAIRAESEPVGIPFRWMNPVGVVDLDGDGEAEIVAVVTPHIGGTLTVYRLKRKSLVEVAALEGFSNHAMLSPELALSTPVLLDGRHYLLVPDRKRTTLRLIELTDRRLTEIGRCVLGATVTGTVEQTSSREISARTTVGKQRVDLDRCTGRR